MKEIGDGAAFAQELGIGDNLELGFAGAAVNLEGAAKLLARANGHGAFFDDQLGTARFGGDNAGDGVDGGEVGLAIFEGRRADAYEDSLGRLDGRYTGPDPDGLMEGFQLWANLPKSHKMMDPRYRDVKSEQVPEVVLRDGAKIRIICGTVDGKQGPVRDIVIDPEYIDVTIPVGSEFTHKTKRGHTVFAYVIGGKGLFCNEKDPFAYDVEGVNYFDMQREPSIRNGMLVLFGDGDQMTVTTQGDPVRFLLISGKPIKEPVAWYGPIVMNTEEELRVAFEEYQTGRFIKYR
jgi:hypothetical protein